MPSFRRAYLLCCLWLPLLAAHTQPALPKLARSPGAGAPRNVVFILANDHRFDFLGFTGRLPWLRTPSLDRLYHEGAYLPNAFVTTALCSPSHTTILTGQYAHTHQVVDNISPVPVGTVFFPQYLQRAGYQTGFFGKWHMGEENDRSKPGFTHWESFKSQASTTTPRSTATVAKSATAIRLKSPTYSPSTLWLG